jgi:23S rRNA (pseudouridine1915-N3)-methyltransferase
VRLTVLVVGKLKSGPERELVDEYLKRAEPLGRTLGFRGIAETEVASGGGLGAEAERLVAKLSAGSARLRLDEAGAAMTSVHFADRLARLRDQGTADLTFLIGGAEGFGAEIRSAVPDAMAFGPQTWPHRLVRVMLAEQIYRALSILSGSPYHKA